MLTVTEPARVLLAQVLVEVEAANDVAIRLLEVEDGWELRQDGFRPDDTVFAHENRTVLVIDTPSSDALGDRTLDVEQTEDGPRLALIG